MKSKLKIGFLLEGYHVPRWGWQIIKQLSEADYAEISGILVDELLVKDNKKTGFKGFAYVIYRLHEYFDQILYGKSERLSDEINAKELLKIFSSHKISAIKQNDYDVIFNFSFDKIPRDLLSKPKFGVWQIIENYISSQNTSVGYWETTQRHPETVTSLWQLGKNKTDDNLLYISSQITDYHSINKNRDKYFKRAILMTIRVLKNLSERDHLYVDQLINDHKGQVESFYKPAHISYSVASVLKNFGVQLKTLLTSAYKNLFFRDHWFVLFKFKEEGKFSTDFNNYTPLISPKDRFWADPFVESRNNRHYLFVEELMYSTSRGRLAVITLDKDGVFIESNTILDTPYHLSYPYIFQYKGEDYMIPETRENGRIDIYKCAKFPDEWVFVKILMEDIQAVDVTPFYHNEKWWVFCNVDEGDGNSSINDEMYLFYCQDLFEDSWVSHPMNPIISDVKKARPAGKIIEKDGKLYRPSQDCSGCYGRALNMNEIIKITETEYEERLVQKHHADWSPELERIHTYNSSPSMSVIDSFFFRKR